MRNHFSHRLTSPFLSVSCGYGYIAALSLFFYASGFYEDSPFFAWGVPVTFMGKTIEDTGTYCMLLGMFFVHQVINNWVNDVTYPWILNCIQDPKSDSLVYSKAWSMVIVNMFALYSELDVVLIIAGAMSQLPFFVMLISANMVSVSIINWQYIKDKSYSSETLEPLTIVVE